MSLALVKNGQIVKYPVSQDDIKEIEAEVGFNLDTIEKRDSVGLVPVYGAEIEKKWNKNYSIGNLSLVGDSWFEFWNESDKPQEEIDALTAKKWAGIRAERTKYLAISDWTQLPDSPLLKEKVQEWAVYRQQLRDITEQPDPFDIWFPAEPEA
jgi:hypothetical protein